MYMILWGNTLLPVYSLIQPLDLPTQANGQIYFLMYNSKTNNIFINNTCSVAIIYVLICMND